MPKSGQRQNGKRKKESDVLTLQDLDLESRTEWPLALRLPQSDPRPKTLKKSPRRLPNDEVLILHGHLPCSALCVRFAVDLPTQQTKPLSTENSVSAAGNLHATTPPRALVCVADRTLLFERFLSAQPDSSISSTGRDTCAYDGAHYSTLRGLLSSVNGDLTRHAVRLRVSRENHGDQSSNTTDYILCAGNCGSGISPWANLASDLSITQLPVWKLKPQHGRAYLESTSLPLDGTNGFFQLCSNVAFQSAQELVSMLLALERNGLASSVRMRALPVDQNVHLPALHADVLGTLQGYDSEGRIQFLSIEAFDVQSKTLILASLGEHSILVSRDVPLQVTPMDVSNDIDNTYCQASRALARVLLRNSELLMTSTDIHVCDLSLKNQLDGASSPMSPSLSTSRRSPSPFAEASHSPVTKIELASLNSQQAIESKRSKSLPRFSRDTRNSSSPVALDHLPAANSPQPLQQDANVFLPSFDESHGGIDAPGLRPVTRGSSTPQEMPSQQVGRKLSALGPPPLPPKSRSPSPLPRHSRASSLPKGGVERYVEEKRTSAPALSGIPPALVPRQGRRAGSATHCADTEECVYVEPDAQLPAVREYARIDDTLPDGNQYASIMENSSAPGSPGRSRRHRQDISASELAAGNFKTGVQPSYSLPVSLTGKSSQKQAKEYLPLL